MIARLILYIFLVVSNAAIACSVGPHVPSWNQALEKASGAVVVQPSKIGDLSPRIVVELELASVIYDPGFAFRGKTIVASQSASANSHRQLAFWMSVQTAESPSPWNCRQEQAIDLTRKYVLLLSVDGPFTLEPILGDEDPWLKLVRDHFAKTGPRAPTMALSEVIKQMRVVSIGSCKLQDETKSYDKFRNCVDRIYPVGSPQLLVEVDGGWQKTMGLNSDRTQIPAEEIAKIFGTDFGLTEGLPLRSFFDH